MFTVQEKTSAPDYYKDIKIFNTLAEAEKEAKKLHNAKHKEQAFKIIDKKNTLKYYDIKQ